MPRLQGRFLKDKRERLDASLEERRRFGQEQRRACARRAVGTDLRVDALGQLRLTRVVEHEAVKRPYVRPDLARPGHRHHLLCGQRGARLARDLTTPRHLEDQPLEAAGGFLHLLYLPHLVVGFDEPFVRPVVSRRCDPGDERLGGPPHVRAEEPPTAPHPRKVSFGARVQLEPRQAAARLK